MLQHMKQQIKRMICRLQHRKFHPHHRRFLTVRQKLRLMCSEPFVDVFGVERLCKRNVNFYSDLLCANADNMVVRVLLCGFPKSMFQQHIIRLLPGFLIRNEQINIAGLAKFRHRIESRRAASL